MLSLTLNLKKAANNANAPINKAGLAAVAAAQLNNATYLKKKKNRSTKAGQEVERKEEN
jgi:hypothetical protein